MSEPVRYALVGLVVILTHFVQGVSGFGCVVLAMPFIAILLGLKVAVPVLITQALLISTLIAVESRRKIAWREFGKIVALVGIGLPVGMWAYRILPENESKWVVAAFTLCVGLHGLATQWSNTGAPRKAGSRPRFLGSALLPLGGVAQGAFGMGGPPIVVYATRAFSDKAAFRATLSLLWAVSNTAIITYWLAGSRIDAHILKMIGFCIPFTLAGLFIGNRVHYAIDEVAFQRVIYLALIVSALVLMWSLVT